MSRPADVIEVEAIRRDFPGLHQQVHGKALVYLDNAATAQVPQVVIDALVRSHTLDRANVHRGVHELSQRASASFDAARQTTADFFGVPDAREVVFVRGTTEGINLVASAWGDANVGAGDEIVVTAMEHHSNLVPWQLLAARRGAVVKAIPFDEAGVLDLTAAASLIGPRTKVVAVAHVSNTLGTVNPVSEIAAMAHAVGAICVVDGAQSAPHLPVDLRTLGADFFAFSAHKCCGPYGIGALWGRRELLEACPPYQGGGGMIGRVTLDGSTWAPAPMRFEAGTPYVAGAVGMAAGLDYLRGIGLSAIDAQEQALLAYATERLREIPGMRIVGTAPHKAGVLSFLLDGAHPTDLGMLLDAQGVAIRTGHHCTQPVMDFYGVSATARASFAFYNTMAEVDAFADAIVKVRGWL